MNTIAAPSGRRRRLRAAAFRAAFLATPMAGTAALPAFAQQAMELPEITVTGEATTSSAPAPHPTPATQTPQVSAAEGGPETLIQFQTESLKIRNETGSLTGLTPFETPASVDIVTQQEMQERGLDNLIQVYNSVPGVMSGNLPGEPGVTSMRGLSRQATGYMVDGMQIPDPLLVSRNYDSFTFDRVEILKGPSSVISGNGSLAGTINLVTKQPILNQQGGQAIASYGSFDSFRAGADYNIAIGQNAAVRASGVYSQSGGYIDDTDSKTAAFTLGATINLTDRLTNTAAVDYFHDDFKTPYQGTPLIAASAAIDPSSIVSAPGGLVIDKALRNENYNVYNGKMSSDAIWARNRTEYGLTDTWKLRNDFGYYSSDRSWANSEDFTYDFSTGLLDRTTTLITHDQHVWYDRVAALFDGTVWGMRHRFAAGAQYIGTDLTSERRFGEADPVSPYFPNRGFFPLDTPANFSTRQDYDSQVNTYAAFMEDAVNITDKWLVTGGARYENIQLDRTIHDLNAGTFSSFDNTFDSVSWRFGTVYNILPDTALFAQYNQATVPVASLLLSNMRNGKFELSYGNSIEAGIKSAFWNNRVVATASVYQIEQYNILTRDPTNPSLTVQGGNQRSRGVELEVAAALTDQWQVGGNLSYIDAEYQNLWGPTGDLSGNRPINVPEFTAMLLTSYRLPTIPLTLNASVQYVGPFFTDTANTIEVQGRTVVDAWLAYEVGQGTIRLRGRNLTNAFYADWSGYSSTQVYLGAPRSFELSYAVKF